MPAPLSHVHALTSHKRSLVGVAFLIAYCALVQMVCVSHVPPKVSVGATFMYSVGCTVLHTFTALHKRRCCKVGAVVSYVAPSEHVGCVAHEVLWCEDDSSNWLGGQAAHVRRALVVSALIFWPLPHVGCDVQLSVVCTGTVAVDRQLLRRRRCTRRGDGHPFCGTAAVVAMVYLPIAQFGHVCALLLIFCPAAQRRRRS